ncbi:C4-dicarboxylate transporter [Lactobacillus nasalidis]|uniref:C4-dicarboxylate transporter n=1 Tax=Lactobacillus nasalidis TaxID=2797258 RepID=A0ABQ3W3L8_9LACO|nr:YfcC family protein [Lactobacillus nasalidis]GHV97812.1 C4-dicarboxylate transporter [Lactobacillus nasalidis]GHV99541.1 C4-dicarboxylate transporter [Lactobacillus nasalidis]GHW01021.1 C4-dicarboxylate transporter [Lactobacillus nasalidis]
MLFHHSGSKKRKHEFPTAYSVIIIVLVLVQILTFFIPAGNYATVSYDQSRKDFDITLPTGKVRHEPATQATLNRYKVKIDAKKLIDGTIYKPVAIPDSYQRIKVKKPNFWEAVKQFLTAQVNGIADSIDIITFILILGGIIGVVYANGAINSGMQALSDHIKGKQILLIVIVMGLIALGGTTFGLAEETMAFYPMLIPVFLEAGYDTMTVVATIFLGTTLGTLGSTINPFSTVIASNTAGVNFARALPLRIVMLLVSLAAGMIYTIIYAERVRKDPSKSLVYDQYEENRQKYLKLDSQADKGSFTWRQKLTLLTFVAGFLVMIWGVQSQGWYFTEIAVVFLAVSYLLFLVSGLSEHRFMESFVSGAADLLGVAFTVGLARAVSIVMDESHTSDTIMYFFSKQITGMNKLAFVWVLFLIYIVLGFFIQSSSGLAVLSMPIMAPLANVVGVDRASVIDAYNWGQGYIGLIAPVGLILMSLAMVNISFDRWFKFIWKQLVIQLLICLLFLGIGLLVY